MGGCELLPLHTPRSNTVLIYISGQLKIVISVRSGFTGTITGLPGTVLTVTGLYLINCNNHQVVLDFCE